MQAAKQKKSLKMNLAKLRGPSSTDDLSAQSDAPAVMFPSEVALNVIPLRLGSHGGINGLVLH